jgi:hypothetical protein
VSSAEVDQGAQVTASRGYVFVNLPGSAERTVLGTRSDLGVGTVVALDRTSVASADLQLFDDSNIKVLGGASIELTRMEVGRFINQHSLVLTQLSGPIRYATGGPIDVVVPNGLVQLAPHGDYTVWIDANNATRVLVYAGDARLSASGAAIGVTEGGRGEIDPLGQVHPPVQRWSELLANSDFALHDQNWSTYDMPPPPPKPSSPLDVNGKRLWVPGPEDGTTAGSALQVVRESINHEHGETGLVQKLDVDVSGYRHLWLRAMVRVDYADLSGGGTFGTEYPMMFRVLYEGPITDSRPDWPVGFYYSNQDNRPTAGASELWPQSEWKQYEVDLMNMDPSNIPYRLLEFRVMGQGHSYDARVAGISLIGA